MKAVILAVAVLFSAGCYKTNIAWRGIVYSTDQSATTDGRIANQPRSGASAVTAPKEYEDAFKADVNKPTQKAQTDSKGE